MCLLSPFLSFYFHYFDDFLFQGSSGDERAMAKEMSAFLGQGLSEEVMAEGQEPIEFWQILGGKTPYASDKR